MRARMTRGARWQDCDLSALSEGPREQVQDSGQAGVIEVADPNGWQQTVHHHTDGERWFRHICDALDSDVDPRSIAESFEFLPTAE